MVFSTLLVLFFAFIGTVCGVFALYFFFTAFRAWRTGRKDDNLL